MCRKNIPCLNVLIFHLVSHFLKLSALRYLVLISLVCIYGNVSFITCQTLLHVKYYKLELKMFFSLLISCSHNDCIFSLRQSVFDSIVYWGWHELRNDRVILINIELFFFFLGKCQIAISLEVNMLHLWKCVSISNRFYL